MTTNGQRTVAKNLVKTGIIDDVANIDACRDGTVPFDAVVSLMCSFGNPAAIVDVSGHVIVVTDEFTAFFPGISAGMKLPGLATLEGRELIASLNSLTTSEANAGEVAENHSNFCPAMENTQIMTFDLDADHRVLLVDNHCQLHAYMQARDTMFTISRAISVSEMAATLAHEINTPISTILNLLQGIRSRLKSSGQMNSEIMKALSLAEEQALFTSNVVSRIRDFTQARQPKKELLSLRSLVEDARQILDWYFRLKGCDVKVKLSSESVFLIEGDAVMLEQVILNLLKNGADAMASIAPEKRRIDISCVINERRLQLIIRDYGHGLSGAQDELFMPFVTNKVHGMGVGLNICRSFLELHHGRLWLSDADGSGCKAVVELPLIEALSA